MSSALCAMLHARALLPISVRNSGDLFGFVVVQGPVRTVAAKSIPGFSAMTRSVAEHSPLRRNVTADDVAGLATFLASDAAAAITGQTMEVDAGHSAVWF